MDTSSGIFTYTPNTGFHGKDCFSYTVSDGNGGIDSAIVSIAVVSPITLEILSPIEGTTLSEPYVIVQGTIANTTDAETGVVVNGIIANLYGNQFAANNVPLQEGQNIIAAIATDANGAVATKSITMNAEILSSFIKLSAYPESGVAPLEITLRINGSFSIINSVITVVFLILIISCLILFDLTTISFALNTKTHKALNEYIAQQSLGGFSLNEYLKTQLGMKEGTETYFKNGGLDQQVFKWIRDGGEYEDQIPRMLAHFLNPLTNNGLFGNSSALERALPLAEHKQHSRLPVITPGTTSATIIFRH
ncbi:MAG: cadherin-like domain-containing protein [Deltaproteobacteria bacterium]|nr:cadherin-like domain-containing protein [Deltaproteobacteria bacterium]